MGIEHGLGGTMITGHGDMPEGGIDYFTLLTAYHAAKMHVESGGKFRMTRIATPQNLRLRLNQSYPNRPDGPFKGKTMKTLLKEIEAEVQRQQDLWRASGTDEQKKAFERIINEDKP